MIFSASETERKISRDELSIVKSEIKTEFGTLKTLMEIKEQNDRKRKQKWAAIGIPVMGSKSSFQYPLFSWEISRQGPKVLNPIFSQLS